MASPFCAAAAVTQPDCVSLKLLYVASWSGVASSLWMMGKTVAAGRLLERQLFHQATATFFLDASMTFLLTWGVWDPEMPVSCVGAPINVVTLILSIVMHGLFFAICLLEVHMAASIFCAASHSLHALRKLAMWLTGIWPLSIAYASTTALSQWLSATRGQGLRGMNNDPIGAAVVTLLGLVTVVFYVLAISSGARSHAPEAAISRMRFRAMLFPPIFMMSLVPASLRYWGVINECTVFGIMSMTAECTAASGNAVAFYITRRDRPQDNFQGSTEMTVRRVVGFEEVVEESDAVPAGSWRKSQQWMQPTKELKDEVVRARRDASGASAASSESDLPTSWSVSEMFSEDYPSTTAW